MLKWISMAALAASLALTGCAASQGASALDNESHASLRGKLVRGRTTQDDVIAMYGQPQNIKQTKNGSTYIYVLSKSHTGNPLHALDKQDLANVVQTGSIGVITGNADLALMGAGAGLVAGRVGQAGNGRTDQAVSRSLIVQFNRRGVLTSYSFH